MSMWNPIDEASAVASELSRTIEAAAMATVRDASGVIVVSQESENDPMTIQLRDSWRAHYRSAELGPAIVRVAAEVGFE